MPNTTQDLVNAIKDQKSALITATFESIMSEKIRREVDRRRESIVDQTFNASNKD